VKEFTSEPLSDPGPARVRVLISGQVQGVNYRYAARQQAQRLGLVGWVRNLRDGRVEAVFQGPRRTLVEMVGWCRTGPPAARVLNVEERWEPPEAGMEGFSIRW
jgi:acylphosphatase